MHGQTVATKGELLIEGKSKRVYACGEQLYVIEMIPSLSSFSFARDEMVEGSDELRLDFYERAAARLKSEGVNTAFVERIGPTSYLAKRCRTYPFEVIVKNVAAGSTLRKYPGLFEPGHRFEPPIVKFDYRVDPEDQCLADDYVDAFGCSSATWKRLALQVDAILQKWLEPRILVDFCLMIGTDSDQRDCVVSEVSPDAMRLRAPSGESLDKDIFRSGAPHSAVIETWRALVRSLR